METVVSIDEEPDLVKVIILMHQQNSNHYIKKTFLKS